MNSTESTSMSLYAMELLIKDLTENVRILINITMYLSICIQKIENNQISITSNSDR